MAVDWKNPKRPDGFPVPYLDAYGLALAQPEVKHLIKVIKTPKGQKNDLREVRRIQRIFYYLTRSLAVYILHPLAITRKTKGLVVKVLSDRSDPVAGVKLYILATAPSDASVGLECLTAWKKENDNG